MLRSNRVRVAAVAGATLSAVLLSAGPALAAPDSDDAPPTASSFHKLRVCESGDDYATNTGNGYYGAYQFDLQTWQGLGYSGRPDQASPATQDQAARRLYDQRGWDPWPACSQQEGLS